MSTQTGKLTLTNAILINLNIMIGTGLFINTVELAKRAGVLSTLMYPLIGLLIFPLIISFAHLMRLYPSQGFYGFASNQISPFAGYMSTWSYFIAKLASAMLMVHVAVKLFQQMIPFLGQLNTYALDICIVIIFVLLNTLNIKTGSTIQMGFLGLKFIPIAFVFFAGLYFFNPGSFTGNILDFSGILISLPLVLHATLGFEATCSLSSQIKDSQKNGPIAIYTSFGIVLTILFLFQLLFWAVLGNQLISLSGSLQAFPLLIEHTLGISNISTHLIAFLHIAIGSSALGGCYGILFSNSWNLYTLAQNKHIPWNNSFSWLNSNGIPILCIILEGVICLLFLVITKGNQIELQQIAAFGSIITYTASVYSLLRAKNHDNRITISSWVIYLALASCLILSIACVRNFAYAGLFPLIMFSTFLAIGSFIYRKKLSY